ncbi:TerD family protein [Nocardia higoensis]|uniref:TerD family protein n=1 Tax=Nocardia higoensis TaxID=228599 RepID=UPI00059498E2|nr:TerD family protein [Nocardia higoensis]
MKLTPGANAPVPTSEMAVTLTWSGGDAVDPQALLVTETGKIRDDKDFVFFNAPRHPSGAVSLTEASTARPEVTVALARVEPEISRIVITGSVDEGSFRDIRGLTVSVREQSSGNAALSFEVDQAEAVTAIVLGEFYRRNGAWKFRCVVQGWSSGLRGLAEEFGVQVDDEAEPSSAPAPVPAPAGPAAPPRHHASASSGASAPSSEPNRQPGWYADPDRPGWLRWWNNGIWSEDRRQIFPAGQGSCERCGRPVQSRFRGARPCRWCENDVKQIMQGWRAQAWQVLTTTGPLGPDWDALWVSLNFHQVHIDTGREALMPLAIGYLERVVTFAFADSQIEEHELDEFERAVATLGAVTNLSPAQRHIDDLRRRMLRGRSLTQVRAGELPRVQSTRVHLEADEFIYLETDAMHVKYLASGPKHTPGRIIASNKKLRFVGPGAGSELSWAKIVSVTSEYGNVVVAATTARGGGTYQVHDAEWAAAVLEGALRVAKRLVLAPGQRDTRSIPPHVRSEVYQRDGGKCCQCGAIHYLEFDHVIPLSRGGATSVNNLQILCRQCNLEKGARL